MSLAAGTEPWNRSRHLKVSRVPVLMNPGLGPSYPTPDRVPLPFYRQEILSASQRYEEEEGRSWVCNYFRTASLGFPIRERALTASLQLLPCRVHPCFPTFSPDAHLTHTAGVDATATLGVRIDIPPAGGGAVPYSKYIDSRWWGLD